MDRAYEDNETRALAVKRGLIPVVPPKRNRKIPWNYDVGLYKRRNEVERFFLRIKRYVNRIPGASPFKIPHPRRIFTLC